MPVGKTPYSLLRSSSFEKLVHIEAEYDRARIYHDRALQRSYENHRMYFGVDFGQWEQTDLNRLSDENRHPEQYNIVGPKVNTLAGSIASEKYEMDLRPVEGLRTPIVDACRDSFYADKELCNFEWAIGQVIKDAMIHSGELKMVKTFDKNPLFGNIAFQRCQPGFVLRDPYWSSNEDKECRKLWETFFLTAEQVSQIYKIENQRIRNEMSIMGRQGGTYEQDPEWDFTQKINRQYLGNLHRVIEFHWMEKIKVKRIQGQKLDSVVWVPFPVTDDDARKEEFMIKNEIDPHTMTEVEYEDDIHMVSAICPTLVPDKELTEGPANIQPKRLPYFHLSAARDMGEDKGVVDDIADCQRKINKNQVKLTHLIGTATGGGKLYPRGLFKTPEQAKRFKERANDPGYSEEVDPDVLKESPIHYLNQNNYPSTLINQFEQMWDMVDRVSSIPAVMEAMSESPNESGVLFERKFEAARLGLVHIRTNVIKWRHDIAEAYYWQWQIDPGYNGFEREMSTRDGKHKVVLNERVIRNGKVFVRNIPSQIPRSTIMITESKYSSNRVLKDRALFQDLYNTALQQNPNSLLTSYLFGKVLDTMELNDKDRAQLDMIKDLQQSLDLARVDTEKTNLDSTKQQALLVKVQALLERERLESPQEEAMGPDQEVPEDEFMSQNMPPEVSSLPNDNPELLATE